MVHRYCVQCSDTLEENFQNKTCKYFNQNYCKDKCSSTCIYFRAPNLNLCYQKDISKNKNLIFYFSFFF